MMSIRVVNAGDGYAYLLRNVATANVGSGTKTQLGDYYQATGTPPGRWYGRGLTDLDSTAITAGTTVTQEHMAALYGEGLHPEADSRIANGASIADVQLGRTYPFDSGGHQVLKELSTMEKQFRYHAGRRSTEQERKHYRGRCRTQALQRRNQLLECDAKGDSGVGQREEKLRSPSYCRLRPDVFTSEVYLCAVGTRYEETRKTIETVHNECVSACLDWLDETALRTRCEVNGVKKLTRTRGLIAAQFVHYDPRSGNPGSSHALPGFKQSPRPRRPMAQC